MQTNDREFIGQWWFGYLLKQTQLPFRIRIRESDKRGNGALCSKPGLCLPI